MLLCYQFTIKIVFVSLKKYLFLRYCTCMPYTNYLNRQVLQIDAPEASNRGVSIVSTLPYRRRLYKEIRYIVVKVIFLSILSLFRCVIMLKVRYYVKVFWFYCL